MRHLRGRLRRRHYRCRHLNGNYHFKNGDKVYTFSSNQVCRGREKNVSNIAVETGVTDADAVTSYFFSVFFPFIRSFLRYRVQNIHTHIEMLYMHTHTHTHARNDKQHPVFAS